MSKTTVLVTAVILIFTAAVVYTLFRLGEVNKQEVVNRYIGSEFSFTYPLGYELLEDGNDLFSVGSTTQNGFVPAVSLSELPISTDTADVNESIRAQLLTLCASDTPQERISCSAVASEEDVENLQGENATMFWLTLTREIPGQEPESRSYGPIYVYIVSADQSDGTPAFSILAVHAPLQAFLAGTVDMQLLTRINDSIKVGKTRRQ